MGVGEGFGIAFKQSLVWRKDLNLLKRLKSLLVLIDALNTLSVLLKNTKEERMMKIKTAHQLPPFHLSLVYRSQVNLIPPLQQYFPCIVSHCCIFSSLFTGFASLFCLSIIFMAFKDNLDLS